MQYKNQLMYGAAVLAVAALFLGIRQWQMAKVAAEGWPDLEGGFYTTSVTRGDVTAYVPMDDVYDSGLTGEGIPALNEPEYVSVAAADAQVADDLFGLAIEVEGEHLFYPVQIMNWHEVVNETINGVPLLITYCPLCGSGVVYERDTNVTFSVSGKVYNNNTLLTDSATGSLWTQATGFAIEGEAAGQRLAVYPSEFVRWKDWKKEHADGSVLSFETGYTRDYTRHPYGNYDRQTSLYFPVNKQITAGGPKWRGVVYTNDQAAAAFLNPLTMGTGVQEAVVGDDSVLSVFDTKMDVVRVFSRELDGKTYTFSYDFSKKKITDNETGSTWNTLGRATDGKLAGKQLRSLETTEYYWFCAQAMFPDITAVGMPETDDDAEDADAQPFDAVEGETLQVELENAGS